MRALEADIIKNPDSYISERAESFKVSPSCIFYAWLTEDLLPKTPQNSVIVMDNATFHKRTDMIKAIKDDGHTLEFLPPYSPDLNPIEHK